ncbi:MAG: ferritin-like domain-containing protein [Marinicaulis sp.]|nr:ferritin-like domain-containing protein [Marinicaulis sp.]NNL89839.1 ferritin-like domain-containing protein [Marinicaulis sp.]
MNKNGTFSEAACAVLNAADPLKKTSAAFAAQKILEKTAGAGQIGDALPPASPARPLKPFLVPPGDVPRRKLGSIAGRAALLHAIAHIEFNAIDLAFDMAVRFLPEIHRLGLAPSEFASDWIKIGAEEAKHFGLINERLNALGYAYGDFPAHNGLWEAAENTSDSLVARLAIAPLILEARGLDVTPPMIDRLRVAGDEESCAVLEVIYQDEIGHVACGKRWFDHVCHKMGQDPGAIFGQLVERRFRSALRPPFNHVAREKAGLEPAFYERN